MSGLKVNFDFLGNFGEAGNPDPFGVDPASFFIADMHISIGESGSFWDNHTYKKILKTNQSTGWTNVDLTFFFDGYTPAVRSPNARIRFTFNEKQDWLSNVRLDNVSVTAVNAPATILLMGLAAFGIAVRSRTKS
uniref:PEP-CTERM sorting domain-containing protein n=1 Tax=Ningiella ruwaisensis TaxID=2364274 RepID=UPI00109FFBEC|nr:PEP-CTERM sorting domain-containing protein [Ningiella ruwaisensis]